MKKLLTFTLSILILTSLPLYANEALIGSWKNNEGLRMDFLSGFKANVGPVIYWEDDEVSKMFLETILEKEYNNIIYTNSWSNNCFRIKITWLN